MNLLIANPPKRRRRSKAARRVRVVARRVRRRLSASQRRAALANLAKARRVRRRRSSSAPTGVSTVARRRRSSSHRSTSRRAGSGGAFGRGFVPPGTLTAVAATAGGFIGAETILEKMADKLPDALKQNYGPAIFKAGVGVLAYVALRRVNRPLAAGLAIGAMTSGVVSAVRQSGLAGLGAYMLPPAVGGSTYPGAVNYGALAA